MWQKKMNKYSGFLARLCEKPLKLERIFWHTLLMHIPWWEVIWPSKKVKFVLGRIKREQITMVERWELAKLCRGKYFKNSESIQLTLELLENYGNIRIENAEDVKRLGRKSDTMIAVNPAVYSGVEKWWIKENYSNYTIWGKVRRGEALPELRSRRLRAKYLLYVNLRFMKKQSFTHRGLASERRWCHDETFFHPNK